MLNKKKLYSIALVSIALVLMLINITDAAPFAYITNSGSNNVSVIDTATNNITAIISASTLNNPYGVAVTLG
jgi:YVTN family beta-propeller protein